MPPYDMPLRVLPTNYDLPSGTQLRTDIPIVEGALVFVAIYILHLRAPSSRSRNG